MELFKFSVVTDPTVLEQGQAINKVSSVMWVERYSEPGEFEIVAPMSSGLRDFLPLGTLISHADTLEVMVVENHEIKEESDKDSTITITGRTFDSILEHRIVGINQARSSTTITEYELTANYTWNQAVTLINDHIANPVSGNDQLTNVVAVSVVSPPGTSEARTMSRGTVAQRLREILEIDDLGVKTVRRNTFGAGGSSTQTRFYIYRGVNKTASVIFSWKAGDLSGAEYLFSTKRSKNTALVQGRYVNAVVDLGSVKYYRRMMLVDASDLDGNLTAVPVGAALTAILNKMLVRGRQALKASQVVTITRADISNVTKYRYRRDYNVGDLVSLDGNFGTIAVMRVTEYVEIEDENGESGHPTLSVPGE